MRADRYLIVNADDFGRSSGINRGVIRAHEDGIVTSASLMVRYAASAEAAVYARMNRDLSVGLHLDLGEWIFQDDDWVPVYQVVPSHDASLIKCELSRQLARFYQLVGTMPSHIDSHQHVHLRASVRNAVEEEAARLGIPVRGCNSYVRYCGRFYGQTGHGLPYSEGVTAEALIRIFTELEAGVTELGCHPGDEDDLETTYRRERTEELNTLCQPRVLAAVRQLGLRLCSFWDVPLSAAAQGEA